MQNWTKKSRDGGRVINFNFHGSNSKDVKPLLENRNLHKEKEWDEEDYEDWSTELDHMEKALNEYDSTDNGNKVFSLPFFPGML